MGKPRIIVFTTAYYPFIGGAEIAIQETIRRLGDEFDFFVITHRMRRDLPPKELIDGATIIRLGFGTKMDRLFLFPFLAGIRAMALLRRHTLLWGVMVSYASIGAFFVKLLSPRVPFILTLQEGDSEAHLISGKFGLIGIWWKMLLASADTVTAISTYLESFSRKRGYNGPSMVIPNGVDIDKFSHPPVVIPAQAGIQVPKQIQNLDSRVKPEDDILGSNHNSKVIITTSRLVEKNGIDILIRAMVVVKKKIPAVRCHILGDGELRARLEKLVRELDLQNEVTFLGSIPNEQLPEYLHAADAFVRPSRSEGMGISFIEALAAGLPIIAPPVGGITDIIEDGITGLFSEPENPNDLAQKILSVLENEYLASSLALAGEKLVRDRFSWDTIILSYRSLFEKLLQRKPFRILIATPMVPPEIGGPARYAANLAQQFRKEGEFVHTVSFSQDSNIQDTSDISFVSLQHRTGVRHFIFFFKVLFWLQKSDVVFLLDQFSAGLPAVLAAKLFRRPVVLRLEGDFVWESFVERTRLDITLSAFYKNIPELSKKERLILRISDLVTRAAYRVVFSSKWRQEMVAKRLKLPAQRLQIVENSWHRYQGSRDPGENSKELTILWAGRMLYLKNLYRLINAFSQIGNRGYRLKLIGDGPERKKLEDFVRDEKIQHISFSEPLPHAALMEEFSRAAFFVLPSLSDVGPNVIAEAAGLGVPFLLTQESGYAEYVSRTGSQYALLIDPLDEKDMQVKMEMLMNTSMRDEYAKRLTSMAGKRDWDLVAADWIRVFNGVITL